MSTEMTGAWFGAALGVVSFAALRWAASRVEQGNADARKKQSAGLIRMVAFTDLLLFPIIGYVMGPMVLNG
jgi:hypothetical protein